MHSRRPLPALALVLPHPPLPSRATLSHLSDAFSPHTPRACSPSTPVIFPKQLVASPRESMDSWGSSNGNGEDEVQWEWKPEHMSLLVRTLDALPGHLLTPFYGPVPPANLLDQIARGISKAQGPLEWPHSVRATRTKLAEIARDKDGSKENMTIIEKEEGQRRVSPASRRPLYRQSSMDFLPSKDKGNVSLSRLSSRLQRTDRMLTTYHPYLRPASRSPSPPTLTPRSDSSRQEYLFAPFHPPRSLRSRTSSHSLGSHRPQPLRRSASSMSTHSNPVPGSTLTSPTTAGELAPVKLAGQIRRSDSFSSTGPSLKRAPSFGGASIISNVIPEEKQPHEPESDDEEKARDKKAKRARTRSAPTASKDEKKKRKEKGEKTAKGQSNTIVRRKTESPITSSTKSKPRPKSTREKSALGPELPKSQLPGTLQASPLPGTPPKTLRRVKTTAFNLASSPSGKKMFADLAEKAEEKKATPSALGSAFELS